MYDPGAERDVWSRPRSKGDDFELSALHPAFIGERKIEKEGKIVDRGGEEEKKGGWGGVRVNKWFGTHSVWRCCSGLNLSTSEPGKLADWKVCVDPPVFTLLWRAMRALRHATTKQRAAISTG